MTTMLADLLRSSKAAQLKIENSPTSDLHLRRLLWLCSIVDEVLAVMREHGYSGRVSSGYRCPALNKAVGGSDTSDHPRALGFDLVYPVRDYAPGARILYEARRRFSTRPQQIIDEGDHIHIGMPDELEQERGTYITELRRKTAPGKFYLVESGR